MIQSQKEAINHLCLEVDNLETSSRNFEKKGAKLVEGTPAVGVHGRLAFFPDTTEGILIELCEI